MFIPVHIVYLGTRMIGDVLNLFRTLIQIRNLGMSMMGCLLVMLTAAIGRSSIELNECRTHKMYSLFSENLLALRAPATTRCDLCLVSFCGIGVQDRCSATSIMSQQPHGMTSLADMIQSSDVYECFGGNTVEVDIMLEYLETQRLTPRHIYREVNIFYSFINVFILIDIYRLFSSFRNNLEVLQLLSSSNCSLMFMG